ncbi:MAG: hypothetical protein AB1797_11870, partial [bacterium]
MGDKAKFPLPSSLSLPTSFKNHEEHEGHEDKTNLLIPSLNNFSTCEIGLIKCKKFPIDIDIQALLL